ncbi:hypothetical protein Tco_0267581 [Tanacetum coccineum]
MARRRDHETKNNAVVRQAKWHNLELVMTTPIGVISIWELNAVDTKLLSAPVSNKIEAYQLFRRNVLVTTLESGFVPAWPTAYIFARAFTFIAGLPRFAPLVVSSVGISRTLAITGQMANSIALVAFGSTRTIVVIIAHRA